LIALSLYFDWGRSHKGINLKYNVLRTGKLVFEKNLTRLYEKSSALDKHGNNLLAAHLLPNHARIYEGHTTEGIGKKNFDG